MPRAKRALRVPTPTPNLPTANFSYRVFYRGPCNCTAPGFFNTEQGLWALDSIAGGGAVLMEIGGRNLTTERTERKEDTETREGEEGRDRETYIAVPSFRDGKRRERVNQEEQERFRIRDATVLL